MVPFFAVILFITWNRVTAVPSSLEPCSETNAENCLKPFQADLDAGISALQTADVTTVALVCRRYDVASKCISWLLYYCPDIKQKYKEKLDAFEYACSHQTNRDGHWPFMPPVANITNNQTTIDVVGGKTGELEAAAIKASVAAGVTVLLVMVCVIADCVSKWRIRRRVKKATAQQADALIKNVEEPAVEDDKNEPKKV